MYDPETILRDLDTLTKTVDLDCAGIERLKMSPEMRKTIQHRIARCLHSLRELEIMLEGQDPVDENEIDVFI